MTDKDDFYSTGDPEIDAAVRHWLPTLPPLTPVQRANINAIFDRARD
jgi:hypothetical protein